jgi:drug/metabolite transporter (DMT)-like permease
MPIRSAALLVLLAALWGGSFVFMRVAVPALGPVVLSFARVALAAIALLAIAYARRQPPDLRGRWRDFAVVGLVNSALPFLLFSFAQQHLTASMGAILNATSPFFAAITAAIWLGEPLTGRKVAGMALGFAGVAVLAGWHPEATSRDTGLAITACLAAAVCYALAGTYTKRRMTGVPSLAIAAASQLAAALALAPALPFVHVPGPVTPLVIANVVALALASTAVAYMIYFKLIADIGPARALTVTFLIPLFGALWGSLFLAEALTLDMVAGGALIIAGTVLALRK